VSYGSCVLEEPAPEPEPAAGTTLGESSAVVAGPNDSWQSVVVLTTAAEGNNSQASQSMDIDITDLAGGANYRVYKTTANGSDYFAPAQALALGLNTINVGSAGFDRAVKIQISNSNVVFDTLYVNGVLVSE
jgi:hypothetical protein